MIRRSPKRKTKARKKSLLQKLGLDKFFKSPIRLFTRTFAVLFSTGLVAFILLFLYFSYDLPNINKFNLSDEKQQFRIDIYSREGNLIGRYGRVPTEFAPYKEFPGYLIEAVLATEDRRFFSHMGIDPIGLIRATITNLKAGRVVEGGSTITQQLAKNLFLTPDRSMKRKFQEMILSIYLEIKYSKEEILELYLNKIYMGSGNYGMPAAAKFYFGKDISNISLSEAASLAGIIKAPSRYSPSNNQNLTIARAKEVISNMVEAGYITASEGMHASFKFNISKNWEKARLRKNYFTDWVVQNLHEYIGTIDQDIVVTTTLDDAMQKEAERVIKYYLNNEGKNKNASQAALVAMYPNGAVRAMVGGVDYFKSEFNRAVDAYRQPGSSFKTIVYLTALKKGFAIDDIVIDEPVKLGGWSPDNYDKKYKGAVTLKYALANSLNSVAVKLAKNVGVRSIINQAEELGMKAEFKRDLSIALGSSETNLLDITAAYAHLANKGNAVFEHSIIKIIAENGKVLYNRDIGSDREIIALDDVKGMNEMLKAVIKEGTGKNAQLLFDVAGKTGTSQNYRDAWFLGYSSDLVTGVWVGNDNNSPMKNVTGGSIPAKIWRDFMYNAHLGNTPEKLPDLSSDTINPGKTWDNYFQ